MCYGVLVITASRESQEDGSFLFSSDPGRDSGHNI